MKKFRTNQAYEAQVRKRFKKMYWITMTIIVVAILLLTLWSVALKNPADYDAKVLWFSVLVAIVMMVPIALISYVIGSKYLLKDMSHNFWFELTEDSLSLKTNALGNIKLMHDQIEKVVENKNGLKVIPKNVLKRMVIPKNIEGYDELKKQLLEWAMEVK